MRRIVPVLLSLFLLASCSADRYMGTWQYTSITRNSESIVEIGSNDTMVLGRDKSFRYDIAATSNHSKGTYRVEKDTLYLTYLPQNKTRRFRIEKLRKKSLIISENSTFFAYTRRK